MKKVILSFVCAVAILSACEKVTMQDPAANPISVTTPSDTTKVKPPVVTPPVTTPPVVTPPATTPPVVTPPVVKPPVVTPPVVTPPVVTPPVVTPPVVTPPVVTPPVVTPPVVTPPVVTPPVVTPPVVAALSFSKDVVPVLAMCENCHTHGWTPSAVATTYYTNLVNKGYVKPASYATSTIYTKLASGHPGSGSISTVNTNKIINWMKAGSLNN